jgi:hypothetical protein
MKKKLWWLIAILIVLAVAILTIDLQPAPPPLVKMGFYGFTNSGARVEALFGISNHPNLSVGLHSVGRLGTNAAKPEDGPLGTWMWSRWEPWGVTSAVSIKTTNEPLRVVFEFRERAAGLRRMPERIKEIWGKLSGSEEEFFTGRKFLVTNQTHIANGPR